MFRHASKIVPKNGHTLVVGVVARISGCASQKELSLEDQVDHAKEEVALLYDGEVEYRVIATKGKGERLDRPELAEVERMVRSGKLDFLIMEDVGRLVRGTAVVPIWGIAVDHGTRCIAPNDCIDTIDETWEEELIAACRDHVGHNAHTSKRLKKKLMNRFRKGTGATSRPIAGYEVPEGAKTFDEWKKKETATEPILAGLEMLKITKNYSAVADYFNKIAFPLGPYCRRKTWNGAMVRRFYKNSLLAGHPGRGFRVTIKHHESGRRISVKNDKSEPIYLDYPHLAFVELAKLEEVNELLEKRNRRYRRPKVNGADPLWRVSRKRSRFPGQLATCWYCGRQYVWGGNGIKNHLMCNGSRDRCCWNSVGFDGPTMAAKIVEVITDELYALDGFEQQFSELIQSAQHASTGNEVEAMRKQIQEEQTLEREQANVANAIASMGMRPVLVQKLNELEEQEKQLVRQRRLLEMQQPQQLVLPQSVAHLRELLKCQFRQLAHDSFEFGDLMRQLVPECHVYLVRLCDGGHLLPRAKVKLQLAGVLPDVQHIPILEQWLTRDVTIDLFSPSQRERIREESVRENANGIGPLEIARKISEKPTSTAVQNALALQRKMEKLGLKQPYQLIPEPPIDYAKLRRHKNSKYRFEPLVGYEPPIL